MIPHHHDVLRDGISKFIDKFFRRYGKPSLDGKVKIDATGVLAVLASIAGEIIQGAPKEMQDALFLSFADSAATMAGIKSPEEPQPEHTETLQ